MRTSDNGIELIKRFEGLRLDSYKAVPTEKYYTIGYGHYGSDVYAGEHISKEHAEQILRDDLGDAEAAVMRMAGMRGFRLNQCQFDALVSFTFNCGAKNLNTLCQYPRSLTDIGNKIPAYNKAGGKVLAGLKRRRAAEKELFFEK